MKDSRITAICASLIVVLNVVTFSTIFSGINWKIGGYFGEDISGKTDDTGASAQTAYDGGIDNSYADGPASESVPEIDADNNGIYSSDKVTADDKVSADDKVTAELFETETAATVSTSGTSSTGWYNANVTSGACVIRADGTREELRSYQEIYGKDPPKPNYPPFLLEFLNKEFCRGAVMVNTDTWTVLKFHVGQNYVCYSRDAFENAAEMPYPDIEDNVVVIDSSSVEEFEAVPGTIYKCV